MNEPTPGRNARPMVAPLARAGEEFQVRLLNQHPIETGCRRDAGGNILEANLLESLSLDFEGQRVFSALTANPPITFVVAVKQSGKVNARWREMKGTIGSISAGERAVAA